MMARGIQNKVLEAIASGLSAIVASAVADGLPAEAMSACRLADAPDAFAASLVDLLNRTPGERTNLAARANLTALSWAERLAPLAEILEDATVSGAAQAQAS